jgi:GAF domain-containing protein
MFTVLDRDVQLHVARSNVSVTEVPRSHSFCQHVITQEGGMIVEDATLDQRFHVNPLVTGGPNIRFYAGFPVDSPDGERIGALCIFDSSPRPAGEVDLALLREFAVLVQNELWRFLTVTAETAPRLRRLAQPWIERNRVVPQPALDQNSDAIR